MAAQLLPALSDATTQIQVTAQEPQTTQDQSVAQSTPSAVADLWNEALKLLRVDDTEEIRLKAAGKLTVLSEILTAAKDKQDQCKDKQWKYKKRNGEVVILRDVFDKVVKWLNKLQDIGEFVAQLDPAHLAIPWAAIKFFLQISVVDSQRLGAVYDGIEMITNLIGRYVIFEDLYLQGNSKASDLLQQAIIKLYASVLTYLAGAMRYYAQNTAKRMAKSCLQITDVDVEKLCEDIQSDQAIVDELARLIDAEYLRKVKDEVKLVSNEARTHEKALRQALVDLNISRIHDQLSELNINLERTKKLELLRWLSTIPYSRHHEGIRSGRQEGSGLWLFEDPQYVQWKKTRSSSLLWIHGSPGSGKSKLISLLIDTLRENRINPQSELLAYVYCTRNATEPERGEPVAIIRSILRQLSCLRPDLNVQDAVSRKYQELQEEGFDPRELTLLESKTLILELLENNPATIIIDALDECVPERRYQLLNALDEFLGNSTSKIKIVVSSRENHEDISRGLEKPSNFSVSAGNNKSDIERFVELEVTRSIQESRLLGGRVSPELQDTLVRTLTSGAQGMFLWVALQLQNLCSPRMKFENDVLQELGRLPKELGDIWSKIYKEVNTASETARTIANTALQWLLCAQGRLSSSDFITAVSFDSTGKVVQVSLSGFLDICGNLVVLDTELDVFRLTHLSVREFLEARSDFAPKITHATAAEICLNTLLTRDWLSSEITWQKSTLYQYATLYWAAHIESCGNDYNSRSKIRDALRHMFTNDDGVTPWFAKWLLQVESASETLGWDDPLKDKIEQSLSHPETCLFAACTFGFSNVVEQLMKVSPSAIKRLNAKGATGLHLASQFGHTEIVKNLLENGAEIDAKDESMETALSRASLAGHEDIVELLLNHGADRQIQGKKYGTALQAASLHGHREVVIRLLDSVDIDAESGQFGTALQAASLRGHERVVRVLLDHGAQVNALGGEYAETRELSSNSHIPSGVSMVVEFLLEKQAQLKTANGIQIGPSVSHPFRDETIVQLLLDGRIDINIQKEGFGPALHAASRGGHQSVVRTLLDAGADITAEGGSYGSAIQAAAVSGNDEVVQLLLDYGVDVNVQSGIYNTALQAACRYQHENIIRILLANKAEVNSLGGIYGSALQAAARTGSKRIMRILLENNADVNAEGGIYCTPLQAASAEGFGNIVQILLDQRVDVNARGGKYGSALQGASGAGHLHVVRLLIENGAKFDAALQIASLAGHDEIILYLLSKGANPNAQGDCFGTPLQIATAAGQEKVARLLLSKGAHAENEENHFGNALVIASAVGSKKLVRLLLEQGADPELCGGEFWIRTAQLLCGANPRKNLEYMSDISPLGSASAAGHDEIVEMLLEQLPKYTEGQSFQYMLSESLRVAASNGHLKVMRLLFDKRLTYDMISDDSPLLKFASANGHEEIVRFLLGKGVAVNSSGSSNAGPLHKATEGNHQSVVQLLLEYGADINENGLWGTALHIASYMGFENLVHIFLSKKAKVNKRCPAESTPLILASAAGHTSIVQLLLHHGADPRAVMNYSSEYETASKLGAPLQAAIFGNHEKVIRLLLDHPAFGEMVKEGSIDRNLGGNDSDSDNDLFYTPPQSPRLGNFDRDNDLDDLDASSGIIESVKGDAGFFINNSVGEFGTALQVACQKGHESVVKWLLNKGADPNIRGRKYGTALQAACLGGFERIVQSLLSNRADVNIESGLYGTALQAAVSNGHENIVKLLIDAGANVKIQGGKPEKLYNPYSVGDDETAYSISSSEDELYEPRLDIYAENKLTALQERHQCGKYGTALQAAAYVGSVNIVHLLLDSGADIGDEDEHGQTPLHLAAYYGHDLVVELLLSRGAEVNKKDKYGRTALRWAANYGYEKLIDLLLSKGAQIDVQDNKGQTAMHRAAHEGHNHVIRKLIEKGLDLNAADNDGNSPLFVAVANGKSSTVLFLLQKGASVHKTNGKGYTPLHQAVAWEKQTIIRLLFDSSADIEAKSGDGQTALHIAAERDNYQISYLLILYGANIEATTSNENTALHIAAAHTTTAVLRLLVTKGADLNAKDSIGRTPLHIAIGNHDNLKGIEVLLEKGADTGVRDQYGKTPFHIAVESLNLKGIKALLKKGADTGVRDQTGKTPLDCAENEGIRSVLLKFVENEGSSWQMERA